MTVRIAPFGKPHYRTESAASRCRRVPSNPLSSMPFVSNPLANRAIVAVRKNGAVATVTRRDLEHTKRIDRAWGNYQGVLLARMGAVITAQRAAAAGELGAHPALRKSLVDLAVTSELLADELPKPSPEPN